jgi:outer membrane protein
MFPIKSMLAALALSLGVASVAAPIAAAQGTTVLVIDQRKIMATSRAGKDIQQKITNIENAMKNELRPLATQIENDGKALEAKTAGKTQEALRADASLRTEAQNYTNKIQNYERRRAIAAQELTLTERKAWGDFYNALRPVLQEVVAERGAQIIVDRSNAVYASPSSDATDLAIQKLDAKTPTISVVRQKMPTQQAQ